MKNVLITICGRAGSKGFKNKNLKVFLNKPLVYYTPVSYTHLTQMKATGEVMSLGQSILEILLKAVRGLETGVDHFEMPKFKSWTKEQLLEYIHTPTDERLYALGEAIRKGATNEEKMCIRDRRLCA